MRLTILIILIFTSLSSLALTYEGKVSIKKSRILLKDNLDNKTYSLSSTSSLVSTYLKQLNNGDFVSLEGTINQKNKGLNVQELNYVGLKNLLGVWVGDDSYCYNFSSFTEFSISSYSYGKNCIPSFSSVFTYIINPAATSWVILVADDQGSYVGDLKFNGHNDVNLELFDPESGNTLKSLHLRK